MTMTFEVGRLEGKRHKPRIMTTDLHNQVTVLSYNTDGSYTISQPYDKPDANEAYGGPAVSMLLPNFQEIIDAWPNAQVGFEPFFRVKIPLHGWQLTQSWILAYQGQHNGEVFLVVEERLQTYEGPPCSWCKQILLDFEEFQKIAQGAKDYAEVILKTVR